MEIKVKLNKPYTFKQRADFIVENNHNKGYEIKEVMAMDTDLYQIRHYPEIAKKLHMVAEPEIKPLSPETNTGTRPKSN